MPIAVEVVPPAQFAAWVASKGGAMPGAKPAAAPQGGTATNAGGNAPPAPAVAGTAVVNPKDKKQLVPLYDQDEGRGAAIARLQAGVLATVKRCNGSWGRIIGAGFDGLRFNLPGLGSQPLLRGIELPLHPRIRVDELRHGFQDGLFVGVVATQQLRVDFLDG